LNFLSISNFSASSCSVLRSALRSLNDSIRQFLFVCSSSFFSDEYSSAWSSRKLSCISSISSSRSLSSFFMSSFSSISSSQSVSAASNLECSSSTVRCVAALSGRPSSSSSSSFTLKLKLFFSSRRSSASFCCSFNFCCSFSTSEAAVLLGTVSKAAILRSNRSLFSLSTRSHRARTVSSSCFKLSICSCNSFSLRSTNVVSVVSVPAVLDTSSSLSTSSSLVPLLPLLPDELDSNNDGVSNCLAAELLVMLLIALPLALLALVEECFSLEDPLEDLT